MPAHGHSGSNRRSEILAAAGEIIAQRGYSNATVREIAESVGILSGSLYHHFRSKEDIVEEILADFFDRLIDGYRQTSLTAPNPLAALVRMVRLAFSAIDTDRTAIGILHNDVDHLGRLERFQFLRAAEDEVRVLWTSRLGEAMEASLLRADLEVEIVYRFAREGVWSTIRWYQPGGKRTIDDIATEFIKVFFHGAATSAGLRVLDR